MKGRMTETYIANEIRKSYMNNGIDQPIYYYRDSQKNGVDLVIPRNGILTLAECKSGTKYDRSDIKAFSNLDNVQLERRTDAVICTADEAYAISDTVIALPVSAI
jgi:predicted AAA+ superfamily ATPase